MWWCILSTEQGVPVEINDHLRIFGKNADEVDYDSNGQCLFCGSRIDEFNFCACGGKLGIDWPRSTRKFKSSVWNLRYRPEYD